MLGRPITTIELIQLNKMFSFGRGYKDLIRDFKKCFNVDLNKKIAKEFMMKRSWSDVLMWLTGEKIEAENDTIPAIESKRFELLEQMLEINSKDNEEQEKDLNSFESENYYIPPSVKFFNMPLFGEIITYKFREPFIKCFLFSANAGQRRKLEKIEDIPLSDELPSFLLRILRKINYSAQAIEKGDKLSNHVGDINYGHLYEMEEIEKAGLKNILECDLFKKYSIVAKE